MPQKNTKQSPKLEYKYENFIPVFRVFKEGKTPNGPIKILMKKDEPFDISKKIEFYQYLGYTVTPI